MAVKAAIPVTMRVRIGDAELEVSGPQAFVEEKVAEFVSKQGSRHEASLGHATPASGAHGHGKATSLGQLFKKYPAKSDVDRVLVAGYYLESVENLESFTAAEIKDAIRRAKVRPPNNPSDVIAKNIWKGRMMQAGDKDGKMAYVLTTDGVEFVEQELKA